MLTQMLKLLRLNPSSALTAWCGTCPCRWCALLSVFLAGYLSATPTHLVTRISLPLPMSRWGILLPRIIRIRVFRYPCLIASGVFANPLVIAMGYFTTPTHIRKLRWQTSRDPQAPGQTTLNFTSSSSSSSFSSVLLRRACERLALQRAVFA